MGKQITDPKEPQQRRVRTKKEIEDALIQATNDSSIASKRSVETLYSRPGDVEFFRYFVPKPQRRSPVINRGYWTRMRAMGYNIEKFASEAKTPTKVVINLGCGYDPYAFQYLNEGNTDLVFLDVDYPDLMQIKTQVVTSTPDLLKLLGDNVETPKSGDIFIKSSHYYAVSCDLRDLPKFTKLLASLFDFETTSFLFTAEVSITYMTRKSADALIEWAASAVPRGHSYFSLLEQMMPSGPTHPFARRMLRHFKSYGSPLNSIETYPRLQDQARRFEERGWKLLSAKDLQQFWREDVSEEDKKFVQSVEMMDEYEEYTLFGQHYFILHTVNTGSTTKAESLPEPDTKQSVKVTSKDTELKVKMGAGCLLGETPVSHGGMFMSRRNELYNYEGQSISKPSLKARVCHTITTLPNGNLLLVGGRGSPLSIFQDCWLYEAGSKTWTEVQQLPEPRYRHCAAALPDNRLLVIGGTSTGHPALIWSKDDGWKQLACPGLLDESYGRYSASLAWNGWRGVLVGGAIESDHEIVLGTANLLEIEGEKLSLKCVSQDSLLARMSAQAVIVHDDVYLVGGVTPTMLLSKNDSLIKLNLNGAIEKIDIEIDVQPLWSTFSLHYDQSDHKIVTYGGGAACYGFGSHWDSIHEIRL